MSISFQFSLLLSSIDANTSDSLNRIKKSKLKYYEFKYDSVSGRKQLGYIGKFYRMYSIALFITVITIIYI